MKKIYLAGFEVFSQNARRKGNELKNLCKDFNLEGLFPLDNVAPSDLSGPALSFWIYEANITLIKGADIMMANLNNFRGKEPDSGTSFEVGYAVAIGTPVWAYMDPIGSMVDQLPHHIANNGVVLDCDGYIIENFGLPRNLMLSSSAKIVLGGARACLAQIMQHSRDDCD